MTNGKKFNEFLTALKTEGNSELIESVRAGFNAIVESIDDIYDEEDMGSIATDYMPDESDEDADADDLDLEGAIARSLEKGLPDEEDVELDPMETGTQFEEDERRNNLARLMKELNQRNENLPQKSRPMRDLWRGNNNRREELGNWGGKVSVGEW